MDASLLSVLSFGFILGIKHAIEPDHVIAVSTIASHSKNLWRAALSGIFWGLGHTATLFIVGLIFLLLKSEIPDMWALSLEFLVGIMLFYLGVRNTVMFRRKSVLLQTHEHDGIVHKHFQSKHSTVSHRKKEASYATSAIIGFIHGLAGSAAMILLTMETVHSVWEGVLYLLIFGFGTVAGMLMFTTLIGIPFVFSVSRTSINHALTRVTGVVSTAFGIYYMYNLGVTEGLFQMWMQ